ncbi:MAG: hypothetical protein IPN76_26245 [Saprospiraceae bacterium]|nr:hypothetical protein [Saprospiraceae bacterium]
MLAVRNFGAAPTWVVVPKTTVLRFCKILTATTGSAAIPIPTSVALGGSSFGSIN